MKPGFKARLIGLPLLLLGVVVLLPVIGQFFPRDHWTREHPLEHPIRVARVKDGAISLEDGRVLRPAGVVRAPGVTSEQFDDALRAMTAQGVEVIRDVGDGWAMLRGEPRFYNWCGTRSRDGSYWAGSFIQMPVSEYLLWSGFAAIDLGTPGLTPRESWRLEGIEKAPDLSRPIAKPVQLSRSGQAFRYEGSEHGLSDCDWYLEFDWKPAPEANGAGRG